MFQLTRRMKNFVDLYVLSNPDSKLNPNSNPTHPQMIDDASNPSIRVLSAKEPIRIFVSALPVILLMSVMIFGLSACSAEKDQDSAGTAPDSIVYDSEGAEEADGYTEEFRSDSRGASQGNAMRQRATKSRSTLDDADGAGDAVEGALASAPMASRGEAEADYDSDYDSEVVEEVADDSVGQDYGYSHPEYHSMPADEIPQPVHPSANEGYASVGDNPFEAVADAPLSTFSIDVDTASYSNVRRYLNQHGQLPPAEAVRIEEMINYFDYAYKGPSANSEDPFATHVEIAEAPWQPAHRLVKIGIKGRDIERNARPDTNLVFLIDVSGSMQDRNKLPLVKKSLGMLVEELGSRDRVSIAVYAGSSGVVLEPTSGNDRRTILDAINRLEAGGSTHGSAGIELAYDLARKDFIREGANRVILMTDGDFNVGVTRQGQLQGLIEEQAKSGVFLTVLGYGMGNYKGRYARDARQSWERELRLYRYRGRSEEDAGRTALGNPRNHRQGCQNPDRVQSS